MLHSRVARIAQQALCVMMIACGPSPTKSHHPTSAWYAAYKATQIPVRVSPDGHRLLFYDQRNPTTQIVRVVNADTHETEHFLELHESCLRFEWNPDNHRMSFFCFGGSSRKLYIWDMADGSVKNVRIPRTQGESWLAWSPNGRYLAYKTSEGSDYPYVVVDSSTLAATELPLTTSVSSLSWAPDSGHLVVLDSTRSHSADIIDLGGRFVRRAELGPQITVASIQWATHGERLLLSYHRSSQPFVHLGAFDLADGVLRDLETLREDPASIAWSADEKRVFFTCEQIDDRPLFELHVGTHELHEIMTSGFNDIYGFTQDSKEAIIEHYSAEPMSWLRYRITTRQTGVLYKPTLVALTEIPGRTVWVPSFDGLRVPLIEYRSTSPLSTPAAIVYVHGGARTSRATTGWLEDKQVALREGIDWLDVNYRGSSGFGKAFHEAGTTVDQGRDVLAAVEYAHSTLRVPYRAIAIFGESDGASIALAAARCGPSHIGILFLIGLTHFDDSGMGCPFTGTPSRIIFVHFKYDTNTISEARSLLEEGLEPMKLIGPRYAEYEFDDEHGYIVATTKPAFEEILIQAIKNSDGFYGLFRRRETTGDWQLVAPKCAGCSLVSTSPNLN